MKRFLLRLAKLFPTALLITSLASLFVFGNYIKEHRSGAEFGPFKFAFYGLGDRIYISAQDYIILSWIGIGLALGIIALYYLDKRRRK